ncbi:SIMPL domain-containing protein [Parvularcula dongshanensis]|uniref:SIMPL domain-containing protein n=1 Tax=Parvularcula dongshanensis TaxID=1173995 RepID=A0A840I1S0_9PROT|nr:hypothetical protein [Parvularcula dongshanensis]
MERVSIILAGLLVGVGAALAGFFIGDGFEAGREPVRSVTVRGLAEREVRADLAEWPLQITAADDDLQTARRRVEQDLTALTAFATEAGLPAGEVIRQRLQVVDQAAERYRQGPITGGRYIITQTVLIRSAQVDLVEQLSRRTSELVERGVVVQDQGPSFVFTALSEIKPEMIAAATRDARSGAEQFAEDSGSRVGDILSASQGYFSISPLIEANPYASPGEQVEKKVRVVTTIDFRIED